MEFAAVYYMVHRLVFFISGACWVFYYFEFVELRFYALGFCDRASWANCGVREKTNKMQQLDVYF